MSREQLPQELVERFKPVCAGNSQMLINTKLAERAASIAIEYAKEEMEKEAVARDKWKAKYEKCIDVINRFDPGIIGMYDL